MQLVAERRGGALQFAMYAFKETMGCPCMTDYFPQFLAVNLYLQNLSPLASLELPQL